MASLRFNKKIYSKVAIDRAAEAYADYETMVAANPTTGLYYKTTAATQATRATASLHGSRSLKFWCTA